MDAAERQRHMAAGQRQFNGGQFWEAHETWEAVWLASDGAERRSVQGLIQVAAALHKLARAEAAPARRLLDKALAKLADAPAAFAGFDLERLRADATQLRDALDRGDAPAAELHLASHPAADSDAS